MKKILIGLIISLAVASLLVFVTHRPIIAQDEDYNAEISKKLDDVLKGQKEILDAIASMKEEIKIIKIRVTQIQ